MSGGLLPLTALLGANSRMPQMKIHKVSSSLTYVAFTQHGVEESAAMWVAIKIVTSAGITRITAADGNLLADNIATTLTGLSYFDPTP